MIRRIPRCQQCGQPLVDHGSECYPVTGPAFDQSQNHLSEVDAAAGALLAAIMKHRSVEMLQNCTYAEEFYYLLDLRRRP